MGHITAKTAFKNTFYSVAGKTGTALVANGSEDMLTIFTSHPLLVIFRLTIPVIPGIVVIKNKPFAKKYLGALVAGPFSGKLRIS